MPVIFFDIGDTLASAVFSDDDRLQKFNVFPEALTALESLKSGGCQMGIISNAGGESPDAVNDALRAGGLFDFFNPQYIFYKKKDSAKAFADVAAEAGLKPDQCVFVGENSKERTFALKAGFLRVAPHPLLVEDVIEGIALVYLRVALNNRDAARRIQISRPLGLVPLKVSGGENKNVYAIATLKSLDVLREKEFDVEVLGKRDEPLQTDLYLVRDDREVPQNFLDAQNFSRSFLAEAGKDDLIAAKSDEGVFMAIPSDQSIEDVHFPNSQHGHNEKLLADFSLFNVIDEAGDESKKNESAKAGFAAALAEESFQLSDEQKSALAKIDAAKIRRYHEAYAALAPIKDDYKIVSRHIRHADNRLVVETLQKDFKKIGGANIQVSKHRFQHEDLFLHNVIAEYPGSEPESLILVTAHLDSTAASSGGTYSPETDPAPGADDDASGVAAVLAMAEMIGALYSARKPKKTIRFALFNAEEHGLIGSKAYARSQAAIRAKIDAVFQMDMIGYRGNQTANARRFEVHAGFAPSRAIEKRSLDLARILEKIYKTVSPNFASQQIYPDFEAGDGADLAAGRSDHASFHERGYAAICVSEDFFAGPKFDSPGAQPNPNYHKAGDRQIDYEYAADIARAIGAAALIVAGI
jgi:leucyl aminopeptidase